MRIFVLTFAFAILAVACGASDTGDEQAGGSGGGAGGGGGSGGSVSGDPLCVAAYEYLREEPCSSDIDVFPEEYTFDLEGCEGPSRLCSNCVANQREAHPTECVVITSCAGVCNDLR